MSIAVTVKWDTKQLEAIAPGKLREALKRCIRKAGATAQRDMRSEVNKRIRARKAIPLRYISKAVTVRKSDTGHIADMEWAIEISGEPVPLTAYPHRQTKKGVSVEVNKGKRTVVGGSFVATMKSGHKGIFMRRGKARLPIRELLGSRPVDVLLHEGEAQAVAERGQKSLRETFERLLLMEIGNK